MINTAELVQVGIWLVGSAVALLVMLRLFIWADGARRRVRAMTSATVSTIALIAGVYLAGTAAAATIGA